jgi:hypothetical protein
VPRRDGGSLMLIDLLLVWWFIWCCGWKKSCTTLDGWNRINNGIINHLSTGAGFLPSIVVGYSSSILWGWMGLVSRFISHSTGSNSTFHTAHPSGDLTYSFGTLQFLRTGHHRTKRAMASAIGYIIKPEGTCKLRVSLKPPFGSGYRSGWCSFLRACWFSMSQRITWMCPWRPAGKFENVGKPWKYRWFKWNSTNTRSTLVKDLVL